MGSASISHPLHHYHNHHPHHLPSPPSSSFFLLPFPSLPRFPALRAATGVQGGGVESHGGTQDPSLLRRPLVSPSLPIDDDEGSGEGGSSSGTVDGDGDGEESVVEGKRSGGRSRRQRKDAEWVDWEDQILEDTVPLVGFVRMILHSGKYESGDRLSPEHEKAILERLLAHHPQYEKKIGCGIDFITIGYHPDFVNSRCLFIVRKDGELVDFSYWKCIKGLIRKKYPLHADSFILRHFRRHRGAD